MSTIGKNQDNPFQNPFCPDFVKQSMSYCEFMFLLWNPVQVLLTVIVDDRLFLKGVNKEYNPFCCRIKALH